MINENRVIYLDGFATTPLAPEAEQAMVNAWQRPTNAGSPHIYGARAAALLDDAKGQIAGLIGADTSEILLTSGATEADNLAILGVARQVRASESRRNRIAISAIEHKAVSEAARHLESEGFCVDILPVTVQGVLDLEAADSILGDRTALVSVMLANNELGTIQPVRKLADLVHAVGSFIHTDAAQAAGKIPVDVVQLDVDYLSMSSHKLYGPAGCGALFVAAGTPTPQPMQFGGGQQRAIRPGTLPIPLIAGFGMACELAGLQMARDATQGKTLRNAFMKGLAEIPNVIVMADEHLTLPGTLSLRLVGVDAEELVSLLSASVCLSTGSACATGQVQPSHVLKAIGLRGQALQEVIRMYFGRFNTLDEVAKAAELVSQAIGRLRRPLIPLS